MNKEEFIKAVKQLKVDLTEEKLEKLNKFYNLLIEWKKKILKKIDKLSEEVIIPEGQEIPESFLDDEFDESI